MTVAKGLALATAGAAIGGGLAAAWGLKVASDMEQANIAFTTLLGSAEKADAFLKKLQAFAATTPFEFPELQTAASSLIAIGIDAEKVIPIMTTLGNVTSGMGTGSEGVKRATIALQQMNAAGRITAEDLNQLRDAGIPVFDLLAGATGKAKEELAAMAQNGKLGRKELEQLMEALETGKGLERFNGLMEAQSKSLKGMFSAFKDTLQLNLAEAMEPFIPSIKRAMSAATPVIDSALDRFAKKSAVLVEQVPNLLDAIRERDAQGIGEVVDNILGNTGEHVAYFRDRAAELLPVVDQLKALFANLWGIAQDLAPLFGPEGLGGGVHMAWEAFKLLLPYLVQITGWLNDNEGVVYALVGAYVALNAITRAHAAVMAVQAAGGIIKWIKAAQIAQTVTKVWTAVQWAWNAAANANPIGLIITAIGALVAGLIYAYNHSETFRNVVQTAFRAVAAAGVWMWENVLKPVWSALQTAWTAVADAVSWAWEHLIKPAWDAISKAASWLWSSVLQPVFSAISTAWSALATGLEWAYRNVIEPIWAALQVAGKVLLAILVVSVFGPILLAWKALSLGIEWAWEHLLKPAWSAVEAGAIWLWRNGIQPAFAAIEKGWAYLLAGIEWARVNVLEPIWAAVKAGALWLYENVLRPIFLGIKLYWELNLAAMRFAYENVLVPLWNAIQVAARWLYETVLVPIFNGIKSAWDGALRGMRWVYDNILSPMWRMFQDAIGSVKTAFGQAVSGIETAWNRMREIAAKPINFVIGTVLNQGLFKAFNSVIDTLGLPGNWKMSNLPLVAFAAGGRVPGYSPNDKADNIPAWLTAGEYVHPVSSVDYYGTGVMEAIRQRKIPREAFDGAIHRAEGGPVYQQLFAKVKSQFPRANLNSGQRNTPDFHGQGMAVDLGEIGRAGGNGTPFLAAMNRWIYDNFKAQTAELIYDGLGDDRPDLKNGADFTYNAATRAQHANHVHWAARTAAGMGAGGSGVGWFDVLGKLRDSINAPLKGFFGQFGENTLTRTIKEVPGQMVDKIWTKAKDAVASAWTRFVDFVGGGDSASGGVKDIVRAMASARGWGQSPQWDALDWIITRESGWNPRAQNPSSTAYGLFQFLDSTWSTVGATKTSDVGQQANAGLRYIAQRYGNPLAAKAFWERNHWYADGGQVGLYDSGGVLNHGDTGVNLSGKPEAVLTNEEWGVIRSLAKGDGAAPLIGGDLVLQVGPGASVRDQMEEAMFQLRRIKRGGALR
ncbi:tape measure protein [Lentzea sp. JNUCC 0626]|uniref:aggregation-promoting factor C-terminal-like domain-containing protein n=1 Tax=Lentzea sp. JNUCC 0626 TaxID=3367513 RepID=UPI0037491110